MFFFRHPRPIIDGRAVAVQVVQQKAARETSHAVLIVDGPEAPAPGTAAAPAPVAGPERGE